jgi:SSS family solute:Na+ symporter
MDTAHISMIDKAVIAIYLIGITAFGIWIGYRRNTSSEQYFLAGHSLGWFTVGAAIFTSNISTIHLVGLAAGGAKEGVVIGNFEWMACFTLILLALIFAPFYINSGVKTLPEFMERRYCPSARTFLAVIGLLGALLIHIGISLFAAAKVFESFLGVNMYTTIIVLSIFTVTYTMLGGLKAVVMTENIQVLLLLGGAVLVTVLGIQALPDFGVHSLAEFKSVVKSDQLHMLHPVVNADKNLSEFSWLGVLLGYPILGIWYWCADQTHVQRVLGAKNLKAGQNGALFAGFLKITPLFLMVVPGVIGYVLWQKGAFQLATTNGSPDYNTMLPTLINHLVPVGLKGLLAACMAAALMSCMAAALNSCATIISLDIVKRRRPETPDAKVVKIGRIATGVIMLLAMLWSTQGGQFGTIFEAINKIPMTFAPAVTTVFVLGVLWKRGTWQAAMTTLYVGSIIGGIYFIVDMPSIGKMLLHGQAHEGFAGLISDTKQGILVPFTDGIRGIPFMLVGPIIAVLCVVIYIVTSLMTPAMNAAEVAKVCWDHPLAFLKGKVEGLSDPRIVTLILLAVVGVLYYLLK